MTGGCYTCVRYLMFVFNVLFWLFGCVILGIGMWILMDSSFRKYVNSQEDFGFIYTGAYIFIVVGCLIMIVGFMGCCGAIREHQCMLGTTFVVLLLIFVLLLAAGIWALVAQKQVEDTVDDALRKGVHNYFNSNFSKDFMDMVQHRLDCCGATRGGEDYPADKIALVETCRHKTMPCNEALKATVKGSMTIVAAVAFVVAILLIVGMVCALFLFVLAGRGSSK